MKTLTADKRPEGKSGSRIRDRWTQIFLMMVAANCFAGTNEPQGLINFTSQGKAQTASFVWVDHDTVKATGKTGIQTYRLDDLGTGLVSVLVATLPDRPAAITEEQRISLQTIFA
jgi:hypothetical protein